MGRIFTLVLTLALVSALAVPANATIVESGKGSFEYDFTEEDLCAFDVDVVGSGQFNYRIRQGKNQHDQAFFLHNTFSLHETLTANGRYVTVSERRTFNETRAVPLGDGLFQFFDIFAGRFTVRGEDGKLLGHHAGVIRGTYTFDTLSDDEPGGEFLSEVEETFHGRFDDDVDAIICAALSPTGP